MASLTNKTALVTGGSRGIGAAIAKRLAVDGANVAITFTKGADAATQVVKAIQAAGGKAIAIQADATDAKAAGAAVEKAVKTFGGLDILVNNAGTAIPKPFEETSLEEMDQMLNLNVRGVFVVTQAAQSGAQAMSSKPTKIPGPDHPIAITPSRERVTVTVAGRHIADTREALVLEEAAYAPVYYIPRKDVDMTQLQRSSHYTHCPYKGDCAYYSIPLGGERSVNAVWTYEAPYAAVSLIREHLAFYPNGVDTIQVSADR